MPQVPIIMPQLGESIAEATIVDIKVKPGEQVVADQEINRLRRGKSRARGSQPSGISVMAAPCSSIASASGTCSAG